MKNALKQIILSVFTITLIGCHSSVIASNSSDNSEVKPQIESQKSLEKQALTVGETLSFHSKVLDEKRQLNIYLPASYQSSNQENGKEPKKYPVIYLLDGSLNEDFLHISGIVQFGSFSWIKMLPESIVVGIANVDRKRDFTYPSNNELDQKELPTSGGSAKFMEFIETELQPLINKTYTTNGQTSIIGQSLGGLLASEILVEKPQLFDNYIIISPSLWWDDASLLRKRLDAKAANKITPQNAPTAIYIGVGKEGETMEFVAKKLHELLKTKLPKTTNLYFNFFEQLDHGDTLHLAVYDAFEKIFKEQKSSD